MSFKLTLAVFGVSALAGACSSATEPGPTGPPLSAAAGGPRSVQPIGTITSTAGDLSGRERFRLEYHNLWVLTGTQAVYLIWYGNWAGNPTTSILVDLATNLGSSPYFSAVTKYPNVNGDAASGGLIYAGSIQVGHPYGLSPTKAEVETVVTSSILGSQIPLDAAGIYVVLLSAEVHVDGFATSWCGYHSHTPAIGTDVRYVVIGSPDRAPTVCTPPIQPAGGPNGNRGADGMASLFAGLLASTITDPMVEGGWYDRNGLELGQKCAWTYGATYSAANGSLANVRLGQRDYLLQQLWWPTKKGGVCALSAP